MLTKQGEKKTKEYKATYTVCRAGGGGETEARKAKDSTRRRDKCHEALIYSRAPLLAVGVFVGARGRNVMGGSGTVCACMPV